MIFCRRLAAPERVGQAMNKSFALDQKPGALIVHGRDPKPRMSAFDREQKF
jgi:hypothetical protein